MSQNCGHQRPIVAPDEHGQPQWNDIVRVKLKNSEKSLFQCHFVTRNPTWTDPGAKQSLRGERPATNRLNQGMALTEVLRNMLSPPTSLRKLSLVSDSDVHTAESFPNVRLQSQMRQTKYTALWFQISGELCIVYRGHRVSRIACTSRLLPKRRIC
jgi:hypothetical protein